MADKPKPASENPDNAVANQAPSAASVSPAPTEVAGDVPGSGVAAGASNAGVSADPLASKPKEVQAEPLSDGTVPTVLAPGDGHRTTAKGKAGLTSIYRKADIMTTLLTFVGAVIAGGIIIGAYVFLTRGKAAAPTVAPKVTKLDAADLNKLNDFFKGNTAGTPSEVLTISSSSLFNGRVAVNSDVKVTGGLDVAGTANLTNLTATKTTNLGITNVGGQLAVNGPLTVQNPALFNGGASFKGNLATTGNGTFGGSLSAASISVQDLSVNGALNINGHLNIGGSNPSASPDVAAGSGASASVQGSDSAGTVTIGTGNVPANANLGGTLVKVTFHSVYPSVPTIVISPDGRTAAALQPFVLKSANWFIICTSFDALSHSSYSFDYWVAQ